MGMTAQIRYTFIKSYTPLKICNLTDKQHNLPFLCREMYTNEKLGIIFCLSFEIPKTSSFYFLTRILHKISFQIRCSYFIHELNCDKNAIAEDQTVLDIHYKQE